MRSTILLAFAVLCACGPSPSQSDETAREPAAVTFDGVQSAATQAGDLRAHGERISWVLGCRGCHGEGLAGQRFYELYASNLTRDLAAYSDFEIERLLRTGVPHDGREIWGMPSEIFQHLSAADMAALIADLRTLKPQGGPTQPRLPWSSEARAMIAKGEFKPATQMVRDTRTLSPVDLGPQHGLGRYITMVTCAECHGPELKGHKDGPPDLIVAGAYSRTDFETLMTKGIPSGGRRLKNPLMADVARERFSHLTPKERDALYAYLKARAERIP